MWLVVETGSLLQTNVKRFVNNKLRWTYKGFYKSEPDLVTTQHLISTSDRYL